MAAYALLLGLMWAQSRPYMRWTIPWGALGRVLAASVAMGAAVWGLSFALGRGTADLVTNIWLLVAQAVVGVVVYTVLLVAFGGLRGDERRFIAELVRRGWRKVTGRVTPA